MTGNERTQDDLIQLLKPEEVAAFLSVSRSTVVRMIHAKELPAVRIRGGAKKSRYGVTKAALKKWIQKNESK